ncbi:SCP2 sterol-binding domain-containing protein [Cellulosilyticum sp. I15G10I2]|uniref:SCP2 sterol-binding domain-containing protein n=1 Tax=Cellulosilyticum sp. I15G10I2 TaxID=1892843 RepID=UPI00085C7753|nr:SCP2 sterol-binding domain-containing protein [Cellulosilyticum sp. I15G10I2]
MKVTLILAQCTTQYLKDSIAIITRVLKELDVEVTQIQLDKLPYFNGKKTKEMDQVVQSIYSSKGVIAITHVPMLSMHGAMQTFFDSATMYSSEEFDKPILAITYSEWLGEVEASEKILKNWSIIGGAEGYKIGLNKNMAFSDISQRLERLTEDFYRLMKQDRQNIASTERWLYNYLRSGQSLERLGSPIEETSIIPQEEQPSYIAEPQIKSFVDLLKQENKIQSSKVLAEETPANLSTKEKTIKDIAHLLKKQVSEEPEEDNAQTFTAMSAGIYKKPSLTNMSQASVKRLHQIPHYFIAKHDKSLEMVLKYTLTSSNEEGFIIINNGDCEYVENTTSAPVVEFMLSEEVLAEILAKKITYQKAFMLGRLKVKGNFAILPKLDQIFTSI